MLNAAFVRPAADCRAMIMKPLRDQSQALLDTR
jgi:hypothetical protein